MVGALQREATFGTMYALGRLIQDMVFMMKFQKTCFLPVVLLKVRLVKMISLNMLNLKNSPPSCLIYPEEIKIFLYVSHCSYFQ